MQLRPAHWIAVDAAAALVVVPTAALLSRGMPGPSGPSWAPAVLLLGAVPAIALRRVWPLAALTLAVVTGPVALGVTLFPASWLAVALVLYVIGVRFAGRTANWLVGLTFFFSLLGMEGHGLVVDRGGPRRIDVAVGGTLLLAGAWVIGCAVRQRRRAAEQRSRQTITDERLRIARELHDVVAHSMSLIAVQAGVAVHIADARPDEARAALASIEQTSRGALHEMRALLGVLREGEAETAPAPGLAALDALAAKAADAGVHVELKVTGEPDGLPQGVGLAAYRVVQEALTNTIKHAGVDRARVEVTRTLADVTIAVTDRGERRPGAEGHGITGMRERVVMYGGEFHAGPAPSGGFAVTARIPLAAP